jgi:hypothetical protein
VGKNTSFVNQAAPYVTDYFARERLAKLGFVSSLETLNADDAEIYLCIDSEVERLRARELKKKG